MIDVFIIFIIYHLNVLHLVAEIEVLQFISIKL